MTRCFFEKGLLSSKCFEETCRSLTTNFAIITDSQVKPLFGDKLLKELLEWGFNADLFAFPFGEGSKTRETKQQLEDQMLAAGFLRDTTVIALGGGVVSDLAGFVASTYCRGVPLIFFPTTLLAIVDASIGGKCGVNTPFGKNLIGTFYPPNYVFADRDFLETLPQKELENGYAEMIKHGLIANSRHFEMFEKKENIASIILENRGIKEAIVSEDPQEKGRRRLLNFGHTVGHAIESYEHFRMSHGTAIASGMLAEAHLSYSLGYLPETSLQRICNVIFPLTQVCEANPEELMKLMSHDKKSLKGKPRIVLLKEIGEPVVFGGEYCTLVEESQLKNSLKWMQDAVRSYHRTKV